MRLFLISWTAKARNNYYLGEASVNRKLYAVVRNRHTVFYGHKMRRSVLENIVMTEKVSGIRDRDKSCWIVYVGGRGMWDIVR